MTDPDLHFDFETRDRNGRCEWRIIAQPEWSRGINSKDETSYLHKTDRIVVLSRAFPEVGMNSPSRKEVVLFLRGNERACDNGWFSACGLMSNEDKLITDTLQEMRDPEWWKLARIQAAVSRCAQQAVLEKLP
jgi:hypothetical protein